ncbi:MAG: hypothetical protein RLP44_18090 [Aggregatilineales bacterium]
MPHNAWEVTVNDKKHVITLDHKAFSGNYVIHLNNRSYNTATSSMIDLGNVTPINIESETYTVLSAPTLRGFRYDLIHDGISVVTGKKITPIEKAPTWAWIIALVSIGAFSLVLLQYGALYTGLVGGIVGMIAYLGLANSRNPYMPESTRIAISLGLLIVCWCVGLFMRLVVQ